MENDFFKSRTLEPIIPCVKKIQLSAKKWFQAHNHIKLTDYNNSLTPNTIQFRAYTLTQPTIKALINPESDQTPLDDFFKIWGSDILSNSSKKGLFVKLVTRSPKDYLATPVKKVKLTAETKEEYLRSFDDTYIKPITSIQEIIESLRFSERAFEDLFMLAFLNTENNLIIRPYVEIKPGDEWRCFVKENELIGISQYDYQKILPDDVVQNLPKIKTELTDFMNNIVIPNINTPDFVADLAYIGESLQLIETNPYGLSDPCLFKDYDNLESLQKEHRPVLSIRKN